MFGNRYFREGLICYFWMFTGIVVWLRSKRGKTSADAPANMNSTEAEGDSAFVRRFRALRAGNSPVKA
jgi:hypothetical protein